ncbi:hypothetical protein AAHH79_37810, partial [Burkholderia pseudomallei]
PPPPPVYSYGDHRALHTTSFVASVRCVYETELLQGNRFAKCALEWGTELFLSLILVYARS